MHVRDVYNFLHSHFCSHDTVSYSEPLGGLGMFSHARNPPRALLYKDQGRGRESLITIPFGEKPPTAN